MIALLLDGHMSVRRSCVRAFDVALLGRRFQKEWHEKGNKMCGSKMPRVGELKAYAGTGAGRVRVGHRGHHTGIREAGPGPERAPLLRLVGLRHAARETSDFAGSETEMTYCSFQPCPWAEPSCVSLGRLPLATSLSFCVHVCCMVPSRLCGCKGPGRL